MVNTRESLLGRNYLKKIEKREPSPLAISLCTRITFNERLHERKKNGRKILIKRIMTKLLSTYYTEKDAQHGERRAPRFSARS